MSIIAFIPHKQSSGSLHERSFIFRMGSVSDFQPVVLLEIGSLTCTSRL